MKIGDRILCPSRVNHISYNDYFFLIEIFYDRNKILLEKCLEKSEYIYLKNQIENEIKIYRQKNISTDKINEQLWNI
jgi:hypothetical protein